MADTDQLLRAMLRRLRHETRSSMVSLYLPIGRPPSTRHRLLHDGEFPAVPELADLPSAVEFAREAAAGPRGPAELSDWLSTRSMRSHGENSFLIRVPSLESFLAATPRSEPAEERRNRDQKIENPSSTEGLFQSEAWLEFHFDHFPADAQPASSGKGELFGVPQERWSPMLAMASALGWHARWESTALNDPVSGLPLRAEFHRVLDRTLGHREGSARPGLIFVNPDEFGIVNERYGREAGDDAIREIGLRLKQGVRGSDFAFRFGAAVFGVLVPSASRDIVGLISDKLYGLLCAEPYLNGSVHLGFRLGTAVEESGDDAVADRATELIRRADRALNAARVSADNPCVVWTEELEAATVAQYDPLSGIYTANPARDYRNMLLLWDTVGIVGSNEDADSLLVQVLTRLSKTFRVATMGFFWRGQEDQLGPGLIRRADDLEAVDRIETPEFDPLQRALIDQATREKRTIVGPPEDSPLRGCVIPVGAEDRPLGFLYLEWQENHEGVGPADLGFLDALAGQLALALDRARLMARERLRQEEEKQHLASELRDLREAIQSSQMIYESGDMDAVLATARRVAPTDVTVLINGESGTGKEVLARTIHQLSKRRNKPLVIVDCGAIATSLIDSELFGHERGAFTGADQRTTGRLAEADQGTILLDEIGELPLEAQSKILRFVQEKQYTRVGSTQPQHVDVRLIAVTNRDLAAEVAAGRFRADLFHRLNVVRLLVPPLRERREDVLALTGHFLERFATQYGKRVRRLSPAAEKIVRAYAWPGNIRELENRMMRAVVLCEGDQIEPAELELNESDGTAGHRERECGPSPGNPITRVESTEDTYAAAVEGIRLALAEQIDAVGDTTDFPPPVGKWVGDDLVLEAYRGSREILSRAAALLAVPETTFRRRLRKARAQKESGLSVRPASWDPVRERIARLVESGNAPGEDVLERIRGELLKEVASRFPRDIRRAAAFLGVTEPTYRRWVGEKSQNREVRDAR